MKVLKVVGIVLLVLAGIYIVAAAIAPSSLVIEDSIEIEATVSTVFDQVNCFDKWPAWSPWNAMDTNTIHEYSDDPCGLGAWNKWNGEKAGQGTQTIVEFEENQYLKTTLVFGGDTTPQLSEWKFSEVDGKTVVVWNFIGSETPFLKRPMNLIGKYFLTSAYAQGLASLKAVAEATPAVEDKPVYTINEVDLPESHFLLISGELHPSGIAQFYGDNFGKIMAYMGENSIQINGHPTGLFYYYTDTLTKMSAAIPVGSVVKGTKEIEYRAIEASKALTIDYYGAYDGTEAAHYAIDDHMVANSLDLNGAVREEYVTDPGAEPDTSKWLTRIIYPVKPKQ